MININLALVAIECIYPHPTKPFLSDSSSIRPTLLGLVEFPTIASTCSPHSTELLFELLDYQQGISPCHYFGKSPPQPIYHFATSLLDYFHDTSIRHHQLHYLVPTTHLHILHLVGKVYPKSAMKSIGVHCI
jgi:hypothetical protein